MHRQNGNKRWWVVFPPPWLIIGAVLILAPVFIFMARDSINMHQEQTTWLMSEKGAAIIRSFEAGVRTGIGMRWGSFQLQKLLMETAEQADIDYLIVTDTSGTIIADSDPLRIGTIYDTGLYLDKIAGSKKPASRQVHNSQGDDTFEVYRGLLPTRGATPELLHPMGLQSLQV